MDSNSEGGYSNATSVQYSYFCPPYSNARFQTLSSNLPYTINATLNVTLAVMTVFANVLVFLAIRRSTSVRLPSKLLLCTLVMTDFGVGLFVQPSYAVFLVMKAVNVGSVTWYCYSLKWYGVSGSMLSCVSFLTMTVVSLDRYIALFFHLKYHEIVISRRVTVLLTLIWSFAAVYASTWLWNKVLWDYFTLVGLLVNLLVLSVVYIKIYRRLRQQTCRRVGNQTQPQQQAGNTLDVAKYRRTAYTMVCIYVLFVLCYLPIGLTHFITASVEHSPLTQLIYEFTLTLVHVNSLLNPLVYCIRMHEIRADVVKRLRKCCEQNT